nr:MAG TPA: hypothetical protein [Caudoviricetes sp.]
MAQLDTNIAMDGIQETIRQLQKADLFTDDNLKAILSVGVEQMYNSVRSAYIKAGHDNTKPRRTGETLRHFTKARKVSRDKRGVPYMYVTISGKDSRDQKYATKGFVLNYGRRTGGKIKADYYWSNAVQAAWDSVNQAMTDKAAEVINNAR